MDLFFEKIKKFDKNTNLKNVVNFYYKNYLIGYINSFYLIDFLLEHYTKYFELSNGIFKIMDEVELDFLNELFQKILVDLSKIFELKIFGEKFGVTPILESRVNKIFNIDKNFDYPCYNLFYVDRCLIPVFGFLGLGVHLNGYVLRDENPLNIEMWLSLRDKNKITFPSMYDNLVGGGVSFGMNFFDTLIKEAEEEASLPDYLIKKSQKIGVMNYIYNLVNIEDNNFKNKNEFGIRNDLIFVYQLNVDDFIPKINDGEVSDFKKINMYDLHKKLIYENDIKFNSMLSIIMFILTNNVNIFNQQEKNIIYKYLL